MKGKTKIPKLVKYTSKDCRCPCGGPAAIIGEGKLTLPMGFGFAPSSSKFQVDAVRFTGWFGECMNCGKEILFWRTKRAVTKFPRSINDKLKQTQ